MRSHDCICTWALAQPRVCWFAWSCRTSLRVFRYHVSGFQHQPRVGIQARGSLLALGTVICERPWLVVNSNGRGRSHGLTHCTTTEEQHEAHIPLCDRVYRGGKRDGTGSTAGCVDGSSPTAGAEPSKAQQTTLQGCLQSGTGTSSTSSQGTSPSSAGSTTSSTGSTATGSTSTGSTGAAGSTGATAGTQGATAQSGQDAGAGRSAGYAASAGAGGGYILRVSGDGGSARTGMPSATAGQTDEQIRSGPAGR